MQISAAASYQERPEPHFSEVERPWAIQENSKTGRPHEPDSVYIIANLGAKMGIRVNWINRFCGNVQDC